MDMENKYNITIITNKETDNEEKLKEIFNDKLLKVILATVNKVKK